MRVQDADYNDSELIDFIGNQQSQKVRWGSDFKDAFLAPEDVSGAVLPWSRHEGKVKFKLGQVTLWAGINGHKKSMMVNFVLLHIAKTQKVGIQSFEIPVKETMTRLATQAAGCAPSHEYKNQFADWNHERIAYYDQLDTVPGQKVLGVVYYMAKELRCEHILIDSLMMCGLTKGEYAEEARFISVIVAAAKALNIHIHLVAHVTKPDGKGDEWIPSRFSIRGAGEIGDKADNIMIVWENKKRRFILDKIQEGRPVTDKELEYKDKNCDQLLICAKQRHGSWEGKMGLWFHRPSLQFLGEDRDTAMPFYISG